VPTVAESGYKDIEMDFAETFKETGGVNAGHAAADGRSEAVARQREADADPGSGSINFS
jgi:hypothetical protein